MSARGSDLLSNWFKRTSKEVSGILWSVTGWRRYREQTSGGNGADADREGFQGEAGRIVQTGEFPRNGDSAMEAQEDEEGSGSGSTKKAGK